MTPDQLILLAKARRRRAEAQGASAPSDVPPVGDMGQWQQSPPVDPAAQRAAAIEQMRGPHPDTFAEKLVASPLVRAGAGALQTAVVGPLQLGANIGHAISPPSAGQFDLAQEIADKNKQWGDTVDSAMGGRADVAGTVGALAGGAAALPGAVPKSLLGRMWYGAKTGGVLGAMAPHEKAGLEENVKSAAFGFA
ncbi:MAG TPA: hypothetical protein PK472_03105, partial [Pseudomonadota bacterium]|nr:hypothetical protein [Pseudomonadota bacterium]